jgi:hypothetical protein
LSITGLRYGGLQVSGVESLLRVTCYDGQVQVLLVAGARRDAHRHRAECSRLTNRHQSVPFARMLSERLLLASGHRRRDLQHRAKVAEKRKFTDDSPSRTAVFGRSFSRVGSPDR